jgi:hypothetical protein
MFKILLSALNTGLAFVFRSLLVKFGIFFALYFVTTGFVGLISGLLPSASSINSALGGIATSTWYFLDAFSLNIGLPAICSAYATRFIIRRIPVIG